MAEAHHRHEHVDLYDVLEISPRASQAVVQAAYRALARNHHPDLHDEPEAAQRIRELNAAYQVLSDPEKRARYDLECARARRHERIAHPLESTLTTTPTRLVRAEAVALQTSTARRTGDDSFTVRNGQVILGMILVAALFAILLGLVLVSVDAATEMTSGVGGAVLHAPRQI